MTPGSSGWRLATWATYSGPTTAKYKHAGVENIWYEFLTKKFGKWYFYVSNDIALLFL